MDGYLIAQPPMKGHRVENTSGLFLLVAFLRFDRTLVRSMVADIYRNQRQQRKNGRQEVGGNGAAARFRVRMPSSLFHERETIIHPRVAAVTNDQKAIPDSAGEESPAPVSWAVSSGRVRNVTDSATTSV